MSRGVVNLGTLEVGLPGECEIGRHEPAILCRGGRQKVANRCGRCGREIERDTEAGGRGDPWMTQAQHEAEVRERIENDDRGEYERPEDRCPPRE